MNHHLRPAETAIPPPLKPTETDTLLARTKQIAQHIAKHLTEHITKHTKHIRLNPKQQVRLHHVYQRKHDQRPPQTPLAARQPPTGSEPPCGTACSSAPPPRPSMGPGSASRAPSRSSTAQATKEAIRYSANPGGDG